MEIETKFGIGDFIFFMNDNKIVSKVVTQISIEVSDSYIGKPSIRITYFIDKTDRRCSIRSLLECNAFKSKEELLASL